MYLILSLHLHCCKYEDPHTYIHHSAAGTRPLQPADQVHTADITILAFTTQQYSKGNHSLRRVKSPI